MNSQPPAPGEIQLSTPRLQLVTPRMELAASMRKFVQRNQAHLAPWSPPAPEGVNTLAHWQDVVSKCEVAMTAGTAVRFWMTPLDQPDLVIGSIGFSQITRGPFCACVMGYQIDHAFEGRGLMREALTKAMHYMFTEQKLHRIGANYRPENVRSGRLLATLGFRIEGFARNYLFIDGAWRDHVLTSLTHDAFDTAWLKAGS